MISLGRVPLYMPGLAFDIIIVKFRIAQPERYMQNRRARSDVLLAACIDHVRPDHLRKSVSVPKDKLGRRRGIIRGFLG